MMVGSHSVEYTVLQTALCCVFYCSVTEHLGILLRKRNYLCTLR
jgi:hypothetical protein